MAEWVTGETTSGLNIFYSDDGQKVWSIFFALNGSEVKALDETKPKGLKRVFSAPLADLEAVEQRGFEAWAILSKSRAHRFAILENEQAAHELIQSINRLLSDLRQYAAQPWRVERAPNGGAIWRGKESIINLDKVQSDLERLAPLLTGSGVGVFILAALANGISGGHAEGAVKMAGIWFLIGALLWVGQVLKPKWLEQGWTLSQNENTLKFQGAHSWAVPLDQIASVEAGKTTDWQLVRKYSRKDYEIPPTEWQTFLVLNDQTRRVVHHANAAREECAALAASIRAHVEGLRASAPSLPSSAAPAGDGFDL